MSGRLSLCAGVEAPTRAEPSSEAARRRTREREHSEEHVLPFYRGICACAEHVRVRAVCAMRAAHLDKSALARPRTTLCASTFLQVVVEASFQRPARDDNGNVEKKTVCSSLLHQHISNNSKTKRKRSALGFPSLPVLFISLPLWKPQASSWGSICQKFFRKSPYSLHRSL